MRHAAGVTEPTDAEHADDGTPATTTDPYPEGALLGR